MPKGGITRREFLGKLGKLGLGLGTVVAGRALGFPRLPEPEPARRDVRLHIVEGSFANVGELRDYLSRELAKTENESGTHFFLLGEGAVLDYFKKTHAENKETVREIVALFKNHGNAHAIFTAYERHVHGNVSNTLWFLSPDGFQAQAKRWYTPANAKVLRDYVKSLHPADLEREIANRSGHWWARGFRMSRRRGEGAAFPSTKVFGVKVTAANCIDAREAIKKTRGREVLLVPAMGFPYWEKYMHGAPFGAVNDSKGGIYEHKIIIGRNIFSLTQKRLTFINAALSGYGVRLIIENGGKKK